MVDDVAQGAVDGHVRRVLARRVVQDQDAGRDPQHRVLGAPRLVQDGHGLGPVEVGDVQGVRPLPVRCPVGRHVLGHAVQQTEVDDAQQQFDVGAAASALPAAQGLVEVGGVHVLRGARRGERLLDQGVSVGGEHPGEGAVGVPDAVALVEGELGAGQDLGGQYVGDGAADDLLVPEQCAAVGARHLGQQLHDAVIEEGHACLDAVAGGGAVLDPEVVLLHVPELPAEIRAVDVVHRAGRVGMHGVVGEQRQLGALPPHGDRVGGAERAAPGQVAEVGEEVVPGAAAGQVDAVAAAELVGAGAEQDRLQLGALGAGVAVHLALVELLGPAQRGLHQPQQPAPLVGAGHPVGAEGDEVVGQAEGTGGLLGVPGVPVDEGGAGQRGEGVHAGVRGQGGDGRGVQAAAEEDADLGVGHQALGDGGLQQVGQRVDEVPLGVVGRVGRFGQPPVAVLADAAVAQADVQQGARGHVLDAREPGRGGAVGHDGRRVQALVGQGAGPVQFARALGVLEEGLDLGAEEDRAALGAVEERLDAEAVAGQDQPLLAQVDDGDAEHAADVVEEVQAVLEVEVQQHLAVGLAAELRGAAQALAQLAVVVDLAVAGEDHLPVVADERLASALGVDQGEPGEGHAGLSGVVELHVVGPAGPQGARHVAQNPVGAAVQKRSVGVGESRDSAHVGYLLLREFCRLNASATPACAGVALRSLTNVGDDGGLVHLLGLGLRVSLHVCHPLAALVLVLTEQPSRCVVARRWSGGGAATPPGARRAGCGARSRRRRRPRAGPPPR